MKHNDNWVKVNEDWYDFYKDCDKSLKTILDIFKSEHFDYLYEMSKTNRELYDLWNDCIIPIHELCSKMNPKEYEKFRIECRHIDESNESLEKCKQYLNKVKKG